MLCCSQTDGQRTASGGKPRTATSYNVPELLNSPFVIVQHRKVSGKGKRKCTSPHFREQQCTVFSNSHPV